MRDLPPIDAVLVTHAHFDHLHRPSLRTIANLTRRKSGKRPLIVVPRNLHDLVGDLGFSRVVELEWWQNFQLGNVEIAHTPRAIGERAWFATFIAAMGDTFCAPASTRCTTPATQRISMASRKSESASTLTWRFCRLAPIIRLHFAMFTPVRKTPSRRFRISARAGWFRCITARFRLSYEPVEEPVQRLLADAEQHGIGKKICVLEEGVTQLFE